MKNRKTYYIDSCMVGGCMVGGCIGFTTYKVTTEILGTTVWVLILAAILDLTCAMLFAYKLTNWARRQ